MIFLLFILLCFFVIRAYVNYNEFKEHHELIEQGNYPIEEWMTINTIAKNINVSNEEILLVLNESPIIFNEKLTLGQICKKQKLDCEDVIANLYNLTTSYGSK